MSNPKGDYVSRHWPKAVPSDCTKLQGDSDCIEQDIPKRLRCESCLTFERLIGEMPEREARDAEAE